jgi:restriction system protein
VTSNNLWAIRAGSQGEGDHLFTEQNYIALGWVQMGNLEQIKPDRESFKKRYIEAYPNAVAAAVPNGAGQIFRFVHEMKTGDLVVYPSKVSRTIYIGRVRSGYIYNPTISSIFPHLREVDWLKSNPRTSFSQGALYEIGSAMSFFMVKTYSNEFLGLLGGAKRAVEIPIAQDETVAQVAEDVKENARDFILKKLAQDLKGHPFADFVAHLLGTMGYRTRVSPEGPDGGVDIIAHKDELGFEPPIIKVQVKSSTGNIGDPDVSALYGKVAPTEFGLLIALGGFTAQAKAFARSKSNLRLIGGVELVDLVLDHYEQFDSRYKGLLPLKRVYVPEPMDDGSE